MKIFVVVSCLILAINATTDQEQWAQFKKTHGRNYRSLREEQTRFAIFQSKLRQIEEHNALYEKGEKTYYLGINQFSDRTAEEYKSLLNYNSTAKKSLGLKVNALDEISLSVTAATVDWRNQGVVTGVKNQGQCGSCWAFSVTGALEGAYAIKTGNLVSLSEQNLMDCSTTYGNAGCDGGSMELAYEYIIDNGIEKETDYPYTAVDGRACQYQSSLNVVNVRSYVNVAYGNEAALQKAVASIGPISVAMDASARSFDSYAGGVYDEQSCSSTSLDHGVLIVGYGEESGTEYWLVKNSWGSDWGESGYIKIAKNHNNLCGLATDASYPIL